MILPLLLFLVSILSSALAARCNGNATPGGINESPIQTINVANQNLRLVDQISNGKHYQIIDQFGNNTIDLVHVWGEPYDWGYAHGHLLKDKLNEFFPKVMDYLEDQLIAKAANISALAWIAKTGLDLALDLSYDVTRDWVQPYVMEEIRGIAEGCGRDVDEIRRVMWLGELTRGACSMFGAHGNATREAPRNGALLQLRALDWDVDGPFRSYPAIVVYHPKNASYGHAWANVGFTGWTAAITGMSNAGLSLSEIGVSYPDSTFGKERYLAPGYPFGFLIRDILQFDRSLDDAINRITNAKRTCDLLLGVGDGNSNEFRGFQYSPEVANVFDDENLEPVEIWHPRIDDVVYWGMDWICSNDNKMLADQLLKYHGNITASNTIRHILPYVQTGDLHIAIYDHTNALMYVSFAASDTAIGPLNAYDRAFMKLDMANIFSEPPPE